MVLSAEALDELEALAAIFGDAFRRCERGCEIEVSKDAEKRARLVVTMGATYPQATGPHLSVSTVKGLTEKERLELMRVAEEAAAAGQVCIYEVATAVGEAMGEMRSETTTPPRDPGESWTFCPNGQRRMVRFSAASADEAYSVPIIDGETLVDRKSTFQAFLAKGVSSEAQINWVLRSLVSRPKLQKATHNMYAYRYVDSESDRVVADNDDDGEDGAGTKMAHILDLFQTHDVFVMVSRWYGGTKLGSDRFKHIAKLTQRVLETNGISRRTK